MPPATPLIKVQYVYSRLDYTMYFIPRSFRYVCTYTLYLFEKLKYNRILEQRKKVTLWRPKSDIHEFRLRGGVDVRDRHQCDGGGLHGLGWNNNDGKKTCCNPSVKSCSTTFQIGSFLHEASMTKDIGLKIRKKCSLGGRHTNTIVFIHLQPNFCCEKQILADQKMNGGVHLPKKFRKIKKLSR